MIKLKELRTQKGLTQRALAEKIDVKNYTIGKWEQGIVEPSISDLVAMADFFECSIDYLIGREDDLGVIIVGADKDADNMEIINYFSKLSPERKKTAKSILRDMFIANDSN